MKSQSSSIRRHLIPLTLIPMLVAGWGCDAPDARSAESLEAARTPVHVDSVFPMEEEISRFRADLSEVSAFQGGSETKQGLVDELFEALERADTTAVIELAMTRDEFAWLYFPNTMYMAPPYELSPALVWYQQQNRSSTGLSRLLRRYSGESLYYTGFRCPDDGESFGRGRIWHGCTVLGELPDGTEVEERIFGSILEWEGRYKLVSFSNEF